MIAKSELEELYLEKKLSMMQIAREMDCSPNRVVYWMHRHSIPRRSISDAVYHQAHPKGDPFHFIRPQTTSEYLLMGLGLGLYWGEGNKANKNSIRIGNSDPELIKMFMLFLEHTFSIDRDQFRFSLQTFTDIDTAEALNFWVDKLDVNIEQFFKPHVTISGSIGTYKRKSKYGVVILYFNNKKLRDIIVEMLPR